MIVVLGHLVIDPAKRDAAVAAVKTLVDATRAEDGNVDYAFSEDLTDPTRVNITEIWASDEAMDAHMATEHLATFMSSLGQFVAGPAELIRYDVSGTTKLI